MLSDVTYSAIVSVAADLFVDVCEALPRSDIDEVGVQGDAVTVASWLMALRGVDPPEGGRVLPPPIG